jgi:hypothetical protein
VRTWAPGPLLPRVFAHPGGCAVAALTGGYDVTPPLDFTVSAFPDPLRIQQIWWRGGRALWEVHDSFRYLTNDGETITVPAGYETDLASVPRVPLVWEAFGGTGNKAAVIHDWLCCHPEQCARARADALFLEALAVEDVELFGAEKGWKGWALNRAILPARRRIMYFAVRLWGEIFPATCPDQHG